MQVFGIVGWKNNGKTTLVERLIANLTRRGYKVGSIKHAHHDVDLDQPGRDSYRHRAAGASETMLATGKRWALMHEYGAEPEASLEQLVTHFSACDLVIVEGYKQAAHNKIEVIREVNKNGLLADQVPNIKAIATNLDTVESDLPILDLDNIEQITDWLLQETGLSTPIASPTNPNDCYDPAQNLMLAQTVWDNMQQQVQAHGRQHLLDLDQCHNLVLATDIVSHFDSPRFDNVAVDGWAIKHTDLEANNYCLPAMDGEANAGAVNNLVLTPGHCLRVFTGARMPTGADTIVMQEDVEGRDNKCHFHPHTKANTNWRPRGEDVGKGDIIIAKGQALRPQDIGLAAATGHSQLPVYEPVKVALFSTGDEVFEIGTKLPDNGIYDVNRYLLKALYQDLHCEVTDLGIIADDYDSLYTALSNAAHNHDLIVTSGGASTGDHDHIHQVLSNLGQVHAWRVAIKPGRPLAFGTLNNDQTLFLGLPGNPVAANVCSLMFGAPLIKALAGADWQRPTCYPQKLGFNLNKKSGRREWIRVFQETQADGSVMLKRSAAHGSGILTSMTKAHGLVEVAEDITYIAAGSEVDYIPFSQFGIQA